jgi:hypothetical protein
MSEITDFATLLQFKSMQNQIEELTTFLRNAERERDEAREAIIATLEQNRHLADGDDCTLAKLKSVVPEWK